MRELLDGAGGVGGLLAAWYGPPDRPATPVTPGRVPPALRAWYAAVSPYTRPVLFNHKVAPESGLYEDEGQLSFCVDDFEYQEFGAAPGDGDPVVHRREIDGEGGWEPHDDGMRLSEFLPALLVHETVEGARYGAAADGLTLNQLRPLLAPLRRLSGPELFTAQYAGEGLLALAWPRGDVWDVRLAARDEALLGYVDGVAGATGAAGVRRGPGEWCPPEGRG
ncbi:hypothetical protein [Streptomyces paludis]|uniref:Uncharacterized protein n=1 Tax=Streptomyces paludis TaxID=2282738 RepID=A0A345HXP3_9ACTN|nr:hypothetical protein [Streptomyces paludis]AXG81467.1 hypothetical protein DVK44_31395 [Streptomyces paludis]